MLVLGLRAPQLVAVEPGSSALVDRRRGFVYATVNGLSAAASGPMFGPVAAVSRARRVRSCWASSLNMSATALLMAAPSRPSGWVSRAGASACRLEPDAAGTFARVGRLA